MVSIVAMLPELNVGVVVLTNQENTSAFESIAYTVLDHYLDAAGKDWVAAYAAVDKRRVEVAEKDGDRCGRQARCSLEAVAAAGCLCGPLRDPWYGDVVIEKQADGLGIRLIHTPVLTGRLEHWQHDTFIARWNDHAWLADAYVTIERAKMKAVSPLADFSFDFQDLILKPVAKGPCLIEPCWGFRRRWGDIPSTRPDRCLV